MNTQRLGKNQRKAYEFIQTVNGWHTFAKDVRPVIESLQKRGLISVCGMQFAYRHPLHCGECQMLSINGHACHETGCPNSRKTWVPERGEWVRYVTCRVCDSEIEEGTVCDCQDDTNCEFHPGMRL